MISVMFPGSRQRQRRLDVISTVVPLSNAVEQRTYAHDDVPGFLLVPIPFGLRGQAVPDEQFCDESLVHLVEPCLQVLTANKARVGLLNARDDLGELANAASMSRGRRWSSVYYLPNKDVFVGRWHQACPVGLKQRRREADGEPLSMVAILRPLSCMVAVAAKAEEIEVERLAHWIAGEDAVEATQNGFDGRIAARDLITDYAQCDLERISDLGVVRLLAVAKAPRPTMLEDAAQGSLTSIVEQWGLGRAAGLVGKQLGLHPCLELAAGRRELGRQRRAIM